jgi:outer membrane biosynthesis protein TonB
VIDERGSVRVLKVLRSVPELDEEAIRVVESSWRFHPATRNGRPVAALSDLIVRFSLY